MTKFYIIALGAALVSACSSDADKNKDGKISKAEEKAEMRAGGEIYLQPGQYEVNVTIDKVDAPGLPQGLDITIKKELAKNSTIKTCMTKEELEKPGVEFFGLDEKDPCTMRKFDRSGDNMQVELSCKVADGMSMIATMQGTFSGTSYTMDMTQIMKAGPVGKIKTTGKISGTRIGDCPKG